MNTITLSNKHARGLNFYFSVQGMGSEEYGAAPALPSPKSTHFTILWITSGQGACQIDLDRYTVEPDTICFIPPGSVYQLHTGEATQGHIISFNYEFIYLAGDHADSSFFKELLTAIGVVQLTDQYEKETQVKYTLQCMLQEFNRYSLLRPEILSGWLKVFLLFLKGLQRPAPAGMPPPRPSDLAKRFFSILEESFSTKRMVADYAHELSVAPGYLTEIVKRTSGYSVSHHIQQRIILEAKRLALYSDASMKQIAYQLGFEEPSHFSKFFKLYSGSNFKEFKRLHFGATENASPARFASELQK
jgi:AraC family transcriptional activator of pobA